MNNNSMGMRKIGILGGTFDPVHLGHMGLAEAAMKECELEEVILMPAYIQPFKKGKTVCGDNERLDMLRLSVYECFSLENSGISISTYEIDRGGVSYTYDTMEFLRKENPHDKLFFIMGSDIISPSKDDPNSLKIETWYRGKELLKSTDLIISTRPEDEGRDLSERAKMISEKYGNNVILLESKMKNINSTMVRQALREGQDVSSLIPPAVEKYIREKKLYVD